MKYDILRHILMVQFKEIIVTYFYDSVRRMGKGHESNIPDSTRV